MLALFYFFFILKDICFLYLLAASGVTSGMRDLSLQRGFFVAARGLLPGWGVRVFSL